MRLFVRLVAPLLLVQCVSAASVTLSLPTVSGVSGSTISVVLSVRDGQNMGAFQCDVLFPSTILEATGVEGGDLPTGLFDHRVVEPGRLRIVMAGDSQNPVKGTGTLFNLLFKILPGEASEPVPLIVDRARAWEQSKESLEMRVIVENGTIDRGVHESRNQWLFVGGGVVLLLSILLVAFRRRFRNTAVSAPAKRSF